MSTAAISCGSMLIVLTISSLNNPDEQHDRDVKKMVKAILKRIVKIDQDQTIKIDNSQVVIETAEIKRIVESGPSILKYLVLAMKDETITFDTFARCYSACDQILSYLDPKLHVYWTGGGETKKIDGKTRLFPRGQANEKEFRRYVVEDIHKKASLLSSK